MTRSLDGVEIAYSTYGADVGGDAPAVVLVHGWAGNRTYWNNQLNVLAERYHVITIDLGGHGESGIGRDDWHLRAFGDDVAVVVEEVGAPKVALVGHSMGGDAVVYAARQLGERVAGLVWIDAFRSLGNEPVSTQEQIDAFLAPFRDDFPAAVDRFARNMFPQSADGALVDRIAADMSAAPREVALGSLRYALNREPPLLAALTQLTPPIVAINPDIAPTDADSMRLHGVETIILKDVGHFLMIEDLEQFNPVLVSTLESFGL